VAVHFGWFVALLNYFPVAFWPFGLSKSISSFENGTVLDLKLFDSVEKY
jgi:hypothetical protein